MNGARWRVALAVAMAAMVAAGCTASSSTVVPRQRVTFAVLSGVYYAAAPGAAVEGAVTGDGEALLRKAIADLNAMKDLDFVVVPGDFFVRPDALSLDRGKAILDELRVPYGMALGEYDGPGPAEAATSAAATASGTSGAAGKSGSATSAASSGGAIASAPAVGCISRSGITWAMQGHGFSGPQGYWSQEIAPGLVVVGLDTVRPGAAEGHVDPAQLEWLERTLSAQRGKAVILVSYHGLVPLHPLDEGTAWRHMMIDNAAAVQEILDRHANVVLAISGRHHFAESRVSGRVLHLSVPSVSVWPLAYSLVSLTPKEAEVAWVPLGGEGVLRRAQERLLSSRQYRGVFPAGEDGDTACIRLFGGKKSEVYPLPGIRP